MKTSIKPRGRNELQSKLLRRGSILVLSVSMLVAIFAFTAFTVDVAEGTYRMYYAACDKHGNWRIASAVTVATDEQGSARG